MLLHLSVSLLNETRFRGAADISSALNFFAFFLLSEHFCSQFGNSSPHGPTYSCD